MAAGCKENLALLYFVMTALGFIHFSFYNALNIFSKKRSCFVVFFFFYALKKKSLGNRG